MEVVTDVSEKATAEEVLVEKKPQSNLVEEITPSYDEKDIMKVCVLHGMSNWRVGNAGCLF